MKDVICPGCGDPHIPYYRCVSCGTKFDEPDPAIELIENLLSEFGLPQRVEDCATCPQAHALQEVIAYWGLNREVVS